MMMPPTPFNAFPAPMAYDPDKHHRRSIRLAGHDYRQPGGYFVTICTHDRLYLLGEINEGRMHLSACGRVAQTCWKAIPDHFSHARLDAFVVMPNHIHGIIVITGDANNRRGAKFRAPTHDPPAPQNEGRRQFGKPKAGSLPTIIRTYKGAVTRQVRRSLLPEFRWQRNYYEHIIRGRRDLYRIRRYIAENPAHWQRDRHHRGNKR